MKLSNEVKATRARYLAAFPVPRGEPGSAFEELCRRWAIRLGEQIAFEHPGQGYGVKRADKGRPIGKDSIANNLIAPGRLLAWDLMTGAGTGRPTLNADPDSLDVTGQFFEDRPEFFQPKNHLAATVPGGGAEPLPPPPSGPAPTDVAPLLAPVLDAMARLEQRLVVRLDSLDATVASVAAARVPTGYVGTVRLPYLGTGQVDLAPKA